MGRIFVGTAGWCIPRASAHRCGGDGTHLERYSQALPCAEINSSFHRPHARETYAKWAASTPPHFRFAVKLPKVITHDQKLRRARAPLERFLAESAGLGRKRGPLLVQLPPSLAFEKRVAARFFALLRELHAGPVVCEPRHESWFTTAANEFLVGFKVARVAADPPTAFGADRPGGWGGLLYFRLHGSPRKYWSRYRTDYIDALAAALTTAPAAADAWCVFDNTASGTALENAFELRLRTARPPRPAATSGATSSAVMPVDDVDMATRLGHLRSDDAALLTRIHDLAPINVRTSARRVLAGDSTRGKGSGGPGIARSRPKRKRPPL